ncbi:hypothetical protein [Carnobacterium maltaromaticum]|uniref:hypothetical protein n=1 Tax=Carnobacterium maltaromaticum TaxID=2751 RepID=UPI00295E57B0|nr:hypothetical protein [Carnobacterium maltaromaticum]
MNTEMASFTLVFGIAVFVMIFMAVIIANFFQTRKLKKYLNMQLVFLYQSLVDDSEDD